MAIDEKEEELEEAKEAFALAVESRKQINAELCDKSLSKELKRRILGFKAKV